MRETGKRTTRAASLAAALACCLACGLAGCGGGNAGDGGEAGGAAEGGTEAEMAEGDFATEPSYEAPEGEGAAEAGGEGAETGLANPWSEAASGAEAAAGAGIDDFTAPEQLVLDMGTLEAPQWRYMEGLAEAVYMVDGNQVTLRKGLDAEGTGDISGDWTSYSLEWTQDAPLAAPDSPTTSEEGPDVAVVSCYANDTTGAAKALWRSPYDVYAYAVTVAAGEGAEPLFLSGNDVNALVAALVL